MAELSQIKENRNLTKKGRTNRALLQKECKLLFASSLVSFIEKQNSVLRKLKAVLKGIGGERKLKS